MADLRYPSRKLTFSDVLIVGLLLLAAGISAFFMVLFSSQTDVKLAWV